MAEQQTRVELLYGALRENAGNLFVQRQILIAAGITHDELFAMDVLASAERGGTDHVEDVVAGQSVCAVCGEIDADGAEANLYYHPVAALRAGIGIDED